MPRTGIIGGGIAGTQLGLFLRQHGIAAAIYTEKTADQHRAARISNVVVRNGLTRARERALGIDDWDGQAPDLVRLNLTVNGPQPIRFSGALDPPSQVVDMRIYWARLLEAFASRGGDLVFGTLSSRDVEQLATQYDLLVVASGRGSLCNMFPRLPEHSPFDAPQRLVVVGICRGVRYPDPLAFDVVVTRGHGEILSFPMFSFEPGLTAFGIEAAHGGAFDRLVGLQRETERAQFEATLLDLLREYAPHLHARIDTSRFQVAGSRNIGHVAITPVVRRGYVCLSNGRLALALGDAHIVMDPITGQGANKASCAAWVLGEAIVGAVKFDEEFCRRVEEQTCEYALPVSDACNARLTPPPAHVVGLLVAAAQHQHVADLYADGFNHPDRLWKVLARQEYTEAVTKLLTDGTSLGTTPVWDAISSLAMESSAGG